MPHRLMSHLRSLRIPVAAIIVAAGASLTVHADNLAAQIYACVNNSSGTIHIVSAATACATNEIKLIWNTQGPAGPAGAVGAAGSVGPLGPVGPGGLAGYDIINPYLAEVPAFQTIKTYAVCPAGKKAIGGGYAFLTSTGDILYTGPTLDARYDDGHGYGEAWSVQVHNGGFGSTYVGAKAICVNQ